MNELSDLKFPQICCPETSSDSRWDTEERLETRAGTDAGPPGLENLHGGFSLFSASQVLCGIVGCAGVWFL